MDDGVPRESGNKQALVLDGSPTPVCDGSLAAMCVPVGIWPLLVPGSWVHQGQCVSV